MAGKRDAQREATAKALVAEARRQFTQHGYSAVKLTEIVSALGMTKGALYHHFDGKIELFRVVVQEIQQKVGDRVAAAAENQSDPWEELVAGCEAFLEAQADPEVQQIMLIDAPAVLGWQEWRAMDEAVSGRLLTEILNALVKKGIIASQPVEPLSHLLSGAMNEAALWLAETNSPTALSEATAVLRRLLNSLRE
ncbi:TetR/AcrR family transcriptional regulator [Leucobacter insecticola]|uniref:TetR/AcrR family transcriptional regulator n=1 Tax=Leucobacter insecticola TaxID=2714934 RepID=A0A6G8FK91_9MICO|nr:TetR/AcrR family transcriptional regulator [Leucobacter insecticola]